MAALAHWMDSYRKYATPATLLEAVGTPDVCAPDDQGAQSFFRNLMGSLDEFNLSTKVWTAYFAGEGVVDNVDTTPEAATEMCLRRIRAAEDHIPISEVSVLADALFKLGRVEESEIACAVAYLAGDRTSRTLSLLAGSAVRQGLLTEAREVLEEAERLHPEDPAVGFCAAILATAEGRDDAAVNQLRALTKKNPGYRPSWCLLIDVLLERKDWDQAVRAGSRAAKEFPLDTGILERLARAYRSSGDHRRALRVLDQALHGIGQSVGADEDRARLLLFAALLKEEAGDAEGALAVYRTLLGQSPGPAVYVNGASCLKGLGRNLEAVTLLDEGLRVHPEHPDLLRNLGEILFEAGRDEEAFAALQKAAEAAPERAGVLFLLASLCLRNRRFEDAAEIASVLVQSNPDHAGPALVLLGDAHRFQGAPEAAANAYRAALELLPGEPEIEMRLRSLENRPTPP